MENNIKGDGLGKYHYCILMYLNNYRLIDCEKYWDVLLNKLGQYMYSWCEYYAERNNF